jgi:glc operon protein GlcG
MVAAAEAGSQKMLKSPSVSWTKAESAFLEGRRRSLSTVQFPQRKARHAAFYRAPSKDGADAVKKGYVEVLAFPDFFPNQGGLPIQVDGQTLGGIAASGAKSEIDEAIAQAGLDALLKK